MYFAKDYKSFFLVDFDYRNEFTEELNEGESKYKHKYVTLQQPCRHRIPYRNCKSLK